MQLSRLWKRCGQRQGPEKNWGKLIWTHLWKCPSENTLPRVFWPRSRSMQTVSWWENLGNPESLLPGSHDHGVILASQGPTVEVAIDLPSRESGHSQQQPLTSTHGESCSTNCSREKPPLTKIACAPHARDAYERACEPEPDYGPTWVNLGNVFEYPRGSLLRVVIWSPRLDTYIRVSSGSSPCKSYRSRSY
jgi:hypothetical protein